MAQGAIGRAQAAMSRQQADQMEENWQKSPEYKKRKAAEKKSVKKKPAAKKK